MHTFMNIIYIYNAHIYEYFYVQRTDIYIYTIWQTCELALACQHALRDFSLQLISPNPCLGCLRQNPLSHWPLTVRSLFFYSLLFLLALSPSLSLSLSVARARALSPTHWPPTVRSLYFPFLLLSPSLSLSLCVARSFSPSGYSSSGLFSSSPLSTSLPLSLSIARTLSLSRSFSVARAHTHSLPLATHSLSFSSFLPPVSSLSLSLSLSL